MERKCTRCKLKKHTREFKKITVCKVCDRKFKQAKIKKTNAHKTYMREYMEKRRIKQLIEIINEKRWKLVKTAE